MNWQFWRHRQPSSSNSPTEECTHIRPLLSLMSDALASPQEKRRVQAHLPTCADCRQAQAWMEATRLAIVERPAALPPVDLRARIARAIAASAETAVPAVPIAVSIPRRSFQVRPAYAAALSIAVAGAFLGHALLAPRPASVPAFVLSHVAVLPPAPSAPALPVLVPSPSHAPHPHTLRVIHAAPRPLVAMLPKQDVLPVRRSLPAVILADRPRTDALPAKMVKPFAARHALTIAHRLPPAHPLLAAHVSGSSPLIASSTPPAPPAETPAIPHVTPPADIRPALVQVARMETPVATDAHPLHDGDALSSIRSTLLPSRHTDYGRRLSMASTGVIHTVSYVQMPMTYLIDKPTKTQ